MTADLNPLKPKIQNFLDQNRLWIEEQRPSRLVVKQRLKRQASAFLVVWATLFSGIPLSLVALGVSTSGIDTLSCQQTNEATGFDCTTSTRKWLGLGPESEHQMISQVVDATVDSAKWSDDRGGGTEKVWITLRNQTGHLRIFETSYPLASPAPTFHPQTAEEINRLLQSDVDTFTLEDDARSRWTGQFSGLLVLISPFVLGGILFTYIGLRSRTVTFDKTNHLYTREIHTLLGTRVKQYGLDDIQAIKVKEVVRKARNSFNPSGVRHFEYCLEISLKSNKKYRFISMFSRQTVSDVARQMQSFIEKA